MRYRVIFSDRDRIEAGFSVEAASVDDAKHRAGFAYAEAPLPWSSTTFQRSASASH